MRILRPLATLLPALLLALACGGSAKTSTGRGIVRDVNREWKQVVIEHGDLPGLMPAMTMNYDVADAKLLDALGPGQSIEFDVRFDGKSYTITRIERLSDADVAAPPGAPGEGALEKLLPEAELAPDFALVDQDGHPRRLSEYRGRVVLLDFVYTDCQGPCSLVTGLHVDVQKALSPEARRGVQFLSVSLDPVHDTPLALGRYAKLRGADLSDWAFLTGPPDDVAKLLQAYGVGTIRQGEGQIEHNVVAFLIDPEGRVARRYLGLKDEAAAIAHDVDGLVRPAS